MVVSASKIFKELTLKDAEIALDTEVQKLIEGIPNEEEKTKFQRQMDGFKTLFLRYLCTSSDRFEWDKMRPVPDEFLKMYRDLQTPNDRETIRSQLQKLVVVKLNGGLGTTMGCVGPKSLISVRNDLTFLDLNVQQIENLNKTFDVDIPLVLMNSFNTCAETDKVLQKYKQVNLRILTFMQSMYPRLNRESLLPLAKKALLKVPQFDKNGPSKPVQKENPDDWYPPGHGDFYFSFIESGLADEFIAAGKDWVFLSNIDNLGATVDFDILNFLCSANPTPGFVMEVTDKTRADVKGGTLTYYQGALRLLELAQVPADRVDEFSSVRTFRIFNTNNLWANIHEVKRLCAEDKIQMEVIVNPKTLDSGINILQLEQAAGAAIKCFSHSFGVNVPRSRFLPVKTTSDLLLVMSNLYQLYQGKLIMSPLRSFPSVPLVKLGSQFKKVKDFLARFASIPDLLELDHLTVSGDVAFGKDIVLKGTVIIIASFGSIINVPSGSLLENKIVSGNLRILDH